MKREYLTYLRQWADLAEGKQILFIKDLTSGPRKYDTQLVRAELSRHPENLPSGDILWVRSETGYQNPRPWAISILEELPPYVPGQPWQDVFTAMKRL
ncbi:MAG: hypothetical protein ACE5I0_08225 [Candidatus Binatia bacterium]